MLSRYHGNKATVHTYINIAYMPIYIFVQYPILQRAYIAAYNGIKDRPLYYYKEDKLMEKKERGLCVCDRCLAAIMSHEGRVAYLPLSPFEDEDIFDEDGFAVCEWCEEETDELFEIV